MRFFLKRGWFESILFWPSKRAFIDVEIHKIESVDLVVSVLLIIYKGDIMIFNKKITLSRPLNFIDKFHLFINCPFLTKRRWMAIDKEIYYLAKSEVD